MLADEALETLAKLRFLSGSDVTRALPMAQAVEVMKKAFADLSSGQVTVPPRTHMALAEAGGDALFMPSYSPSQERMGVKIVTLFERNRDTHLPFIQALVVVLDATNGSPIGVMDGATITAIRTGAASGAATDVLARRDATVAAIFGAGTQGRTQLEAVCAVREISQARIFDPDRAAAETFAREMSQSLGLAVQAAADSTRAVAGADVICTATTADRPVFDDADLSDGVHISAVGSHRPNVREIPPETVARARVVVDQAAAALEEAGDLIMPMRAGLIRRDHVTTELGSVVAGMAPGRQDDGQITLFKSVGVAVQDLAATGKVLENAEQMGLGTELEL